MTEDTNSEETPLCPGCLQPILVSDYYCPHCGEACGQLTPVLPFVNLRYEISFYGKLWRRIWNPRTGWSMRVTGLLVIIGLMPIMLMALPFTLWERSRPLTGRAVQGSAGKN